MGRRKRRKRASPTLFDLPLHGAASDAEAPVTELSSPEAGANGAPSQSEANDTSSLQRDVSDARSEKTAGRGPSILFDRDEIGGKDDSRLEQIELESSIAEVPQTEDTGRSVASIEEQALLGDRLLSGLADLAAQLIALGLVIAAVHSMGLVVTVGDWPPFGVLALVFSFLYWSVPLAFWGQTPGMAWVGHLARSSGGEPLSFGQTFLRWLGSVLTLAFAGLPLLLTLTGRSLTDRISDSRTNARG